MIKTVIESYLNTSIHIVSNTSMHTYYISLLIMQAYLIVLFLQ